MAGHPSPRHLMSLIQHLWRSIRVPHDQVKKSHCVRILAVRKATNALEWANRAVVGALGNLHLQAWVRL
ncbi:hypothetical protein NDU88_002303 [Pleurodeles waltl]|uniref:Uncharacterized protein n=1 Tax=Pleurodeles waltl TaxID=8319 RepID=A0AAV7U8W4_PLEWA|nr:hypothetical protein NDU88_002301 [Pleurodeles waltl]KAJ1185511.1 hypothetical protein NDU88_002303 [Pleurodeles waltl]